MAQNVNAVLRVVKNEDLPPPLRAPEPPPLQIAEDIPAEEPPPHESPPRGTDDGSSQPYLRQA